MDGDILGVLLSGGLSRRMGGGDKALLDLGGMPLARHVIDRFRPQVCDLILNANGDPERFAALVLPVVADEVGDFSGPLAGVLSAMRWARRERAGVNFIASVSADAPFVPADLVSRLSEALAKNLGARVAVAASRGRRHHVIGVWRLEAEEDIAAALARGERKVETMVDRLGAVAVEFADAEIGGEAVDPFFNINTPDDFAMAERLIRQARGLLKPLVFGVVGWKNSGKTTLVERLVSELTRRGFRVSTVKHSHHDIAFEVEGTDSARHRKAGAREVALVAPKRWAIVGETGDVCWHEDADVALETALGALSGADVVIVEGFKRAAIPKIEVRRREQGDGPPIADDDPNVLAIAADHEVHGARIPTYSLDDVAGIAAVIVDAAKVHWSQADKI
jgi:molybdenum cofactor guanylyltransferase/molybdopterin-guanine dinucleotide biosynthesis protein MobB